MLASRKNPAAYQVKRSAVKKTHIEKRGIDMIKHNIPATAADLGLLVNTKTLKTTKKAISCIFMC